MNIKEKIAQLIHFKDISEEKILSLISVSPKDDMGDYSIPLFGFSKEYKMSPQMVANEILANYKKSDLIDKIELMGSYLNFFLNTTNFVKEFSCQFLNNYNNFYTSNEGKGKTICIDYCSVNLAKYMHIGHFNTTILGESLARMFECSGYKVVRINYVGDFGLPFGKMIVAYQNWGNINDLKIGGIDYIQGLYVKFCSLEESDETLLERARNISKLIESGDKEVVSLYNLIIGTTIEETKKLVDRIGVRFDDWRGESFYNDKMSSVIEELTNKGLAKRSEGALIVDLSQFNMGVSVVQRSDGASLYVTRDIAAAEDRYNLYNYDKMLYVTAVQQADHFTKLFKITELLNKPFANKLVHIAYGMISLPEGKIASRRGKQAVFVDILDAGIEKAKKVLQNREFKLENKEEVSKKVAKSAIAISILKGERIKDTVFDLDSALNFDGETAPYLQYTYARTCSIIRKAKAAYKDIEYLKTDFKTITSATSKELIKQIYNLKELLVVAKSKYEPSILVKNTMNLAQIFNKLYVEEKFLTEDMSFTMDRLAITFIVQNALKFFMNILCVDVLEEM